jgi:tetratricopeptide (TPR) repeat protein
MNSIKNACNLNNQGQTRNSAMNSIKYACSLNNQGVDLLISGNSLSAMKSFQSARKLLKEPANEVKTTSCSGMTLSNEKATLPFHESPETVPGLENMEFYFCNNGLMITDTTNGESEEMLSLYNAIVLFNLALAYHREGRLGRAKSLKKAALLYSMTVQLLNGGPTMPDDDMSATILTLFALNNKTQIHYDLCKYIQSVDCAKSGMFQSNKRKNIA